MTENVCFGDVLETSRLGGQFSDKLSFLLALDLLVSFAVKLAHVLSIVKYFQKEKLFDFRLSIIVFLNVIESI